MSDHHQERGADTPLYGDGPGASWPPTRTQAMRPYTSLPDQLAAPEEPLQLPELLDQLGEELGAAANTFGRVAELLREHRDHPADEPVAPGAGESLDLTRYDHLAVNTVKDDAYGADADLPTPGQGYYDAADERGAR